VSFTARTFSHGRSAIVEATHPIGSNGLGRIVVDAREHTLYLFEKDNHGKSSSCGGSSAPRGYGY
jgi:hypothetical protein